MASGVVKKPKKLIETQMKVWLLEFHHKHGDDLTVYLTKKAAEHSAEEIREEWYPDCKSYKDIGDSTDWDEYVAIQEEYVWRLEEKSERARTKRRVRKKN